MFYRIAADVMLATHVLFVAFVVGGLMLILAGRPLRWSWVRRRGLRLAHLAAIGIVVGQAWLGIACPLTVWEAALRASAGEATYTGSFIAHWLHALLYFEAQSFVFTAAYTAFGGLVLLSWFWVRPDPSAAERGVPRRIRKGTVDPT